ncbi:MAG: aminotransferase class I/II-fold pyridoxal phosphate-dependent enzyme, partial [Ilumatobacteraceae bacterium]
RVAFYAGDADIVNYLKEVRKHVGMMVPGPAQAAGVVALEDDQHVEMQRQVYLRRLARVAEVLSAWSGLRIGMPDGGFYLWFDARDGWEFAERLAREGGALVSPGDFYGAGGANNVRVAVVQPDHRIDVLARRLGA